MRFLVLGPFEVWDAEFPVDVGGLKRRRLLCRLVTSAPAPVPAAALADALWGGTRRAKAADTLRSHISAVRSVLGKERVVYGAAGYRLVLQDGDLDAQRFRSALENGLQRLVSGEFDQALSTLQSGLSLWRGPALALVADASWAAAYVADLNEARSQAIIALLCSQLAVGQDQQALSVARTALAAAPCDEDLTSLLMVALSRCGRHEEALDLYGSRLGALRERGLVPGAGLRQVEQAVLTHDPLIASGPVPSFVTCGRSPPGRPGGVVAPSPQARASGIIERFSGQRFFGREDELGRFDTGLGSCRGLRTLVVEGEPGMGKTRLLAAMAERAAKRGATAVYGAAVEAAGPAMLALSNALRDFLAQVGGTSLHGRLGRYPEQLVRLVPEVREMVPGLAGVPCPPGASPELERWQLFNAVTSWLGAAGGDEPTVLLLDDLQWSDQGTLTFLRHVLASVAPTKLVLVLAYRSGEARRPLLSLLGSLRADASTTSIMLEGLSLAEVSSLVSAANGTLGSYPRLSEEFWRRTGGNPFFVHQLLGAISGDPNERPCGYEADVLRGLPGSVVETVRLRVGRLRPKVGEVLSLASLVGTEFKMDVVAHALRGTNHEVLSALEDARRAGLVEEVSPFAWRFRHDILREALAASWGQTKRSLAHDAIARALGRYAPEDHAALCSQYSLAHGRERLAAQHASAAAEQAMARLAYEEAATWCQRALELLGAAGEARSRQVCQLQVRQGEAAKAAGYAEHREILLSASRLAKELGDTALMARAALSNGRSGWSFAGLVDTERIESLEAALAVFTAAPSADHARLLAALAGELVFTPQSERRHKLARKALHEVRQCGDDAAFVDVACSATIAMWEAPLASEFRAVAAEAVAPARRLGDPERLFQVSRRCYLAALDAGDMSQARKHADEIAHIAAELGEPALRWLAMMFEATLTMLSGRLAEAEELIETARGLGATGPGTVDGDVWYFVEMMLLRFQQGRLGELAGPLATVSEAFPLLPTLRAGTALAYVEAGKLELATAVFDRSAAANFDEHPSVDCTWLVYLACYADVAYRLRRPDAAKRLYELLCPYRHMAVACGIVVYGSAEHYLGLLAAASGDKGGAKGHLDRAAALHAKWDAPTWVERTRAALAEVTAREETRMPTADAEASQP